MPCLLLPVLHLLLRTFSRIVSGSDRAGIFFFSKQSSRASELDRSELELYLWPSPSPCLSLFVWSVGMAPRAC